MSYIGRGLQSGAFRQLDDISSGFDGSDTTHTMQVNSTNVTVGDVNQILLSLGGVIQKPGTDFTVSSSTLTFTTAPAANTSFFAILLGSDNGGTVTPTDASVTVSKLAIAGGEVKLDADGDTSLTADTDDQIDIKIAGADDIKITANKFELLSGTSLDMDGLSTSVAAGDIITVAGKVGNTSLANATTQVLEINAEAVDRGGNYDTTNDRFIVPKAGVYYIQAMTRMPSAAANRFITIIAKNGNDIGGTIGTMTAEVQSTSAAYWSAISSALVALSVDDYIQVLGYQNSGGAVNVFQTYLNIFRVGTSS
jgi:hypothetical protein